jgi:hypothetical protein
MHRDGITDSLLEASMNSCKLTWLLRSGRVTAGTIFVGLLCLVEVAGVPTYTRHNAGDWVFQMRTRVLPARLPHTIQLCIHCRDRPAGFWVSCTGGQTVRRPWCLSCCEGLDRDRCDVIPFDS